MLPSPSMHRDLRCDQQAKLPQNVLAALPRMRGEKFAAPPRPASLLWLPQFSFPEFIAFIQ